MSDDGLQGMTEARIEVVAELMRSLRFERGATARRLAKDWGVSLKRVHQITAIASKRVRAEVTDPDRVGAKVGAVLERIADRAAESLDAGELDPRMVVAVTGAAKAWAHLAGANAPERLEVTSRQDGEAWQGLPSEPAPRRAALVALRARVDAMIADCDRALGGG